MKVWSALIGVFFLGALVLGCGGGGGDETITKAEFVAQGNAICKESARERKAIEKRWFEKQGKSDGELSQAASEDLYVEMVVPHLERMVADLEALGEPVSGSAEVVAITDSFHQGIGTFQADPSKTFKLEVDPFENARKEAKAYGLKGCAEF